MLPNSNRGSAATVSSAQPASGDQDVKMTDSANKGSEGSVSLSSKVSLVGPWTSERSIGMHSHLLWWA